MKVYIVTFDNWGDSATDKVFSTREAAEHYHKAQFEATKQSWKECYEAGNSGCPQKDWYNENYYYSTIEEFEVE